MVECTIKWNINESTYIITLYMGEKVEVTENGKNKDVFQGVL